MGVIEELRSLSPLRKNQQQAGFYLLFVNALIIACTASFYVKEFGSEGLVLKDYAVSLLALMLFVPLFGRLVTAKPLNTFKVAVGLEVMSVIGYFMTSLGVMPKVSLLAASFCVVQAGIIMRPTLNQVDSIVTNGSACYSLLKSKLDALYMAVGAMVGASFLLLEVSKTITVLVLGVSLLCSRFYRKRVLNEIYADKVEGEWLIEPSVAIKV
jgi:hypothetical protein